MPADFAEPPSTRRLHEHADVRRELQIIAHRIRHGRDLDGEESSSTEFLTHRRHGDQYCEHDGQRNDSGSRLDKCATSP